jgi:2,4-dienoyl-CoA reductase-like NADH-dependent reductase (Old Yellow Enzyme family)
LYDPLRVANVTLAHRMAMSPMCQYSAVDGFANDWHLVHLGSRAVGGAALVIAEATAVEERGRISPGDLGIWSDAHVPGLERIAHFIEQQGAVAGIQIAHAGRKASTAAPWDGGKPLSASEGAWTSVAPSAVPFDTGYPASHSLTRDELVEVRDAFRRGAERARTAGFRWLELHAAHGYLLHSFLSPLSNHRDDEYGGSFENRIRFPLEVVRAVREVWPTDRALAVRLSCTDWVSGAWTLDDSVRLSRELNLAGVDLIDCSSGGSAPHVKVPAEPEYQVAFATRIKREAEIATAAVGLITTEERADAIVSEGKADLVLLGRELLRNPYFPIAALRRLGATAAVPKQYARAFPTR